MQKKQMRDSFIGKCLCTHSETHNNECKTAYCKTNFSGNNTQIGNEESQHQPNGLFFHLQISEDYTLLECFSNMWSTLS